MKGLELPINTLIIIVLAMVILLAILAMLYGVWTPGSAGLTLESAKNSACQMLMSTGCRDASMIMVYNFDADRDGEFDPGEGGGNCNDPSDPTAQDNLYTLCKCWYSEPNEQNCREEICNCPKVT